MALQRGPSEAHEVVLSCNLDFAMVSVIAAGPCLTADALSTAGTTLIPDIRGFTAWFHQAFHQLYWKAFPGVDW